MYAGRNELDTGDKKEGKKHRTKRNGRDKGATVNHVPFRFVDGTRGSGVGGREKEG